MYIPWALFSAIWLVIICALLFSPSTNLTPQSQLWLHADKLVHFLLFGVWALLLCLTSIQRYNKLRYLLIIAIVVIVAIITELIQGMTTYRAYELMDVLADILGALIVTYIFYKSLKSH